MFDSKKVKKEILKIKNWPDENENSFLNMENNLNNENKKIIQSIVKNIHSNNNVDEFFKEEEIEEMLFTLLLNYFQNPNEEYLDKLLSKFKKDLSEEIEDWTMLIGISNLTFDDENYNLKVGDVEFATFSYFQDDLINLFSTEENFIKFTKDLKKSGVIAKATSRGREEFVDNKILNKIRISLNILNFYKSNKELPIIIEGEKKIFNKYSYLLISDSHTYLKFARDDPRWTINFEKERLNHMKEYQFDLLEDILNKNKPSHLEERIINAIYLYSESKINSSNIIKKEIKSDTNKNENLFYSSLSDSFLKLFYSLESLFMIEHNDNIIDKLSKRVVLLLFDNCEDRMKNMKELKRLYGIRSKMVHEGNKYVSNSDLNFLSIITQNCIIKILNLKEPYGLKTKEDLKKFFDKLEVGDELNS